MKSQNTPPPHLKKARTGIEGFDEITHGGLPRGRTTLLEGGPGSGKTILALQSLVYGACYDNELGIFVAFEESSERIMANAEKFGWDLGELQKEKLFFLDVQPNPDVVFEGTFDLGGMLAALEAKAQEIKARRIVFDAVDVLLALLQDPVAERREMYRLHEWLLAHGFTALITAKIHLLQIKRLAKEHSARCVVIDPVSALAKAGNESTAYSVAERLIDWTKASGITLLCTSLLHEVGVQEEGTPMQISTIADTWLHLNYLVHAGERNRGLSIIKSRGTAHFNQVREIVLSSEGVTLADA